MSKMNQMDYNSLLSDRRHNLESKTDRVMKEIAIITRKRYSKMAGEDGRQIFNVTERKGMLISN